MKKIVNIIMSTVLSLVVFNVPLVKAANKTTVTFMIGKEEIATQINETINAYNESQDLYQVEVIPLAGQNANEKMMSLYASNNAPVLMNTGAYEDLAQWNDKLLDLSDLPMVEHIDESYLEPGTIDGKLIGLPTTIEAFGFLYNKNILSDVIGEGQEITAIDSRQELADLFKNITEGGNFGAIEISPMDWSLGAHFSNLLFTNQSEKPEERENFMKQLKAGEVKLIENEVFNAWVDTLDLMKEHNIAKDSPLSADYDSATIALASDEIVFWFMGNWAVPQINEMNEEVELGMLPVPIFEEEGHYGNQHISIGVPNTWAIDAAQSTPEEQAGAKDFLTWLYTDEQGQDYYYNVMKYIPITDNATVDIDDEFTKGLVKFIEDGKGLEWMNAKYPATAFPTMGASLQKYLADELDREGLAKEIEEYWQSAE